MIDFDKLKLSEVPVDYDSPLVLNVVQQMSDVIAKRTDEMAMKAFIKAGFDIDKGKMVQILQGDKKRYEDAYRRGYMARDEEIVRCKDCNNKECWGRAGDVVCGIDGTHHRPEWFCADGERNEEVE